ncbi:stage VI sporulation protein D [Shouchella lonarensis]|uniref:Stage VI sporulation protein D n=1 Tax=Shouchella lonarensis TaxID=1464122 RepID=A0A1G6K0M9_9BACI|nr:stage VI sporulation protein D [Shouchella lonarensis]SDC24185.1 stage VI sporulation protein D [Shouchella lonarensis]
MTEAHSSTLTFSIEDSVRLVEGQEVDEILGMTLTPEISIEEKGEQVTIQGGLRFIAEYRLQLEEESEEGDGDLLSELSDFRAASEMVQRESGGIGRIEHVFPLDITIPMARIQHVDDIYVEVEGFDYELPDSRSIDLTADVCISGVRAQAVESTETEEMEEIREEVEQQKEALTEEEPALERSLETTFSYEATRRLEENVEPNEMQTVPSKQVSESEKETTMSGARSNTETQVNTSARMEPKSTEEVVCEKEEMTEQQQKVDHSKRTIYLTDMFDQGEEKFTRWRMCIIQSADTLTSIAERYDLTEKQLTRFNNLSSDQLEEGQILYIPVSAK